jgi:hypothetical protein
MDWGTLPQRVSPVWLAPRSSLPTTRRKQTLSARRGDDLILAGFDLAAAIGRFQV